MRQSLADQNTFHPQYRLSQASNIGKGGCCVGVQKWTCLKTQQEFAVKILSADKAKSSGYLISNEVKALHTAKRRGIPRVVQLHTDLTAPDGAKYLLLEYLEGITLEKAVLSKVKDESLTLDVAAQLLDTLQCLHAKAKIAHLDVSTSNIMLVHGMHNPIKLIDFGYAQSIRSGPVQPEGLTCSFAAPEVLFALLTEEELEEHEDKVDGPAADVWSAGVVLYRLLTGTVPFAAAGSVTDADLPSDLTDPNDCKQWKERANVYDAQLHWADAVNKAQPSALTYPSGAVTVHHTILDRVGAVTSCPDEAVDFFVHILDPVAQDRLTVPQALQHPWLCKAAAKHAGACCGPHPSCISGSSSSTCSSYHSSAFASSANMGSDMAASSPRSFDSAPSPFEHSQKELRVRADSDSDCASQPELAAGSSSVLQSSHASDQTPDVDPEAVSHNPAASLSTSQQIVAAKRRLARVQQALAEAEAAQPGLLSMTAHAAIAEPATIKSTSSSAAVSYICGSQVCSSNAHSEVRSNKNLNSQPRTAAAALLASQASPPQLLQDAQPSSEVSAAYSLAISKSSVMPNVVTSYMSNSHISSCSARSQPVLEHRLSSQCNAAASPASANQSSSPLPWQNAQPDREYPDVPIAPALEKPASTVHACGRSSTDLNNPVDGCGNHVATTKREAAQDGSSLAAEQP